MTEKENELDYDAIIQEVAKRHNVLLTSDDPVLITATLNQIVLQSLATNTNQALENLQTKLEEMYWRQSEETKTVAKKMINATITATREAITGAVEVSKNDLSASVKSELELFIAQCNKQTNGNKHIKNVTVISCAVAVVCTVVVLGVVILKLA